MKSNKLLANLRKKVKKSIKKVIKKTKINNLFLYNLLRKNFNLAHKFAYYYEHETLKERYIFYEASCSEDFNSNPYAMFKYLINNKK